MNLRSEVLQRLLLIEGFAKLLHKELDQNEVANVDKSEEYKEWASKILDYSKSLHVLLDAITFPQYRESFGLPELSLYDNLMEAVRATAQKLKLPLAEAMDDATKIFVHHKYPLVLLDEPKYFREISFRLANSKYVVELLSWVDNRMFQKEQEVILSSLDDVAKVINLWLLEKQTIKEIQDVYPVDYTD